MYGELELEAIFNFYTAANQFSTFYAILSGEIHYQKIAKK